MADPVQVVIDTDSLVSQLQGWQERTSKTLGNDLAPLGSDLVSQIQAKVPYLTGTLSHSVRYQPDPSGGGLDIQMGEGVPYADWIEYGAWGGLSVQPEGRYVKPTLDANQSRIESEMESALQHSVDNYPWSQG